MHPAPALALLALSGLVFFATFLGYGAALLSILAFYLLASIWFVIRRYKFVRRGAQFTADPPRPEGYSPMTRALVVLAGAGPPLPVPPPRGRRSAAPAPPR